MIEHELPGASFAGSETMSAAGRGGGMVECVATTASLAEVVELLGPRYGPPESSSETNARWVRRHRGGDGRATTFVDAWVVGQGWAPGFVPALVPDGAHCVVAFGSVAGGRRRWWRRGA